MKKHKSVLYYIKTISFYVLTLFLLAYVFVNLFIPEKVIDVFGFQVTTISRLTKSMTPTIEPGDLIVLKKIDEEDIDEDDVISFYNYAKGTNEDNEEVWVKIRVVHRVIEIDEQTNTYVTQGDNNPFKDVIYDQNGEVTTLSYDQVIGAYVFRLPIVGTIASGLRNPIIIGLLAVNIGIVVLIIKLVKKKDKGDQHDMG